MDSTIAAALIAGGAAAGVAVVGTVTTAWTTARTLRSNRETAGEARLWEKTSAVYEELLRFVNIKQIVREHGVRSFRFDEQSEQEIQAQLDSWERPEYPTIEARIDAYASDTVRRLYVMYSLAERAVSKIDSEWDTARNLAAADPGGPESQTLSSFKPQLNRARETADVARGLLVGAIRNELREGHLRRRRGFVQRLRDRKERAALEPGRTSGS
jgi:hypothetical protein